MFFSRTSFIISKNIAKELGYVATNKEGLYIKIKKNKGGFKSCRLLIL